VCARRLSVSFEKNALMIHNVSHNLQEGLSLRSSGDESVAAGGFVWQWRSAVRIWYYLVLFRVSGWAEFFSLVFFLVAVR